MAAKKDPTIKERLSVVETRMEALVEKIDTHLKHHWAVTLAMITTALSSAGTLLMMLIRGGE